MESLDTKEKRTIPDKWFIIPIILLGLNFVYRLINQSKLIFIFPLDHTSDLTSYMAQLFFLAKCGFNELCPYWYNGFITFKSTAPAWFFFTLPIYWLTNNIQLSTYLSMIIIFILIFIAIYFFGKLNRFSNVKIMAFFLFLFANAIAIGNFIRLGRVHELFGWLSFIIIAFMALWYKNRKLDKKFYLIIFPLSLVILSHQYLVILSFAVIFSLFIVKRRFKDRIKLGLISFISLVITSFWWVPFLLSLGKNYVLNYVFSKTLFLFTGQWFWQNIAAIIIPIGFCILFYFYWASKNRSRKELLFFIIPLILSALLLFRIIYFVPILKHMYPDSLNHMFIFFSIFLLFKLDIKKFPSYFKKLIPLLLVLIAIVSICFNMFYTPFFVEHSILEQDTIEVLNKATGKFLILDSQSITSYSNAYYSYAPIYLNLTTSDGWYPHSISKEYMKILKSIENLLETKNCSKLNQNLNYLNTTNIIAYNQYCAYLKDCNFKKIYKKENICLFKTRRLYKIPFEENK